MFNSKTCHDLLFHGFEKMFDRYIYEKNHQNMMASLEVNENGVFIIMGIKNSPKDTEKYCVVNKEELDKGEEWKDFYGPNVMGHLIEYGTKHYGVSQ